MYFDRFDICEACYVWAVGWNGGRKAAEIFARLDRIGFTPRPNLSEDTLEENALAIYDAMGEDHS